MLLPLIVFTFHAAATKTVLYAGDLTGWTHPAKLKNAGGDWSFSADLPSDARVEYKFVVDKQWTLDPSAPHCDNGVGGENSYWQGPDYKIEIPDETPQHPMTRQLLSVEGRDVVVYKPDQYAGLPILIYADGDNYEARGKVQNVAENLAEQGKMRPVILVLITPHMREVEYWHKSSPYEQFVAEKVLPAVRAATGASDKASDVFVGGSSLGGLISFRLAEDYPSVIAGGIHSQSGAFQYDKNLTISVNSLKKLPNGIRISLDYGTYEEPLGASNEIAISRLKDLGFTLNSFHTPEGHTWTAWRHRMVAGLEYLLPA